MNITRTPKTWDKREDNDNDNLQRENPSIEPIPHFLHETEITKSIEITQCMLYLKIVSGRPITKIHIEFNV